MSNITDKIPPFETIWTKLSTNEPAIEGSHDAVSHMSVLIGARLMYEEMVNEFKNICQTMI
jgi:hypothetical protein